MCWLNNMATPIVLKKPLRVYKIGTSVTFNSFISLYRDFLYLKCLAVPAIKINPKFITISYDESWSHGIFHIDEGYHSYLT